MPRPRGARLGGVEPRVPAARAAQRRRLAAHVRRPRARRSTTCACCTRRSTSTRVVTIGHSAGGHLAALAGDARRAERAGDAAWCRRPGVLDLERAWELRLSNGVVRRFLGGTPGGAARALRRRLARRAAAARRARAVDARRQGRHRPARDQRGVPRAATGCDLVLLAGRGPLRPPRPGEPVVEGGGRVAPHEPRASAAALDARRPARAASGIASSIDDPTRIYLDGNSLGRLPLATRDRLAATVAQWGARARLRLARLDRRARAGRRPARRARHRRAPRRGDRRRLDHGQPLQAVRRRARGTRGGALVTDRGNFPTDRYVLEGLAAPRGRELRLVDDAEQAAREDAALVVLSHVGYRSGEIADMAALTAAPARGLGPLALRRRDPRRPQRRGVELAVGCTYKYLNGGPGAPGYLYVAQGAAGGAALADLGLVRPARPVRDGARLRPGRRHRALPGRHAADPRRSPPSRRA